MKWPDIVEFTILLVVLLVTFIAIVIAVFKFVEWVMRAEGNSSTDRSPNLYLPENMLVGRHPSRI